MKIFDENIGQRERERERERRHCCLDYSIVDCFTQSNHERNNMHYRGTAAILDENSFRTLNGRFA